MTKHPEQMDWLAYRSMDLVLLQSYRVSKLGKYISRTVSPSKKKLLRIIKRFRIPPDRFDVGFKWLLQRSILTFYLLSCKADRTSIYKKNLIIPGTFLLMKIIKFLYKPTNRQKISFHLIYRFFNLTFYPQRTVEISKIFRTFRNFFGCNFG